MKFEKVKYTAQYEGQIKVSEWVNIEVTIEGTETPEMGLDAAKQKIEDWHNKGNDTTRPDIKTDHTPEDKRVADLIKDIYACTEIAGKNGLQSFKKIVDKDSEKFPEVKSAYNQKYNQLNNKKAVNLP